MKKILAETMYVNIVFAMLGFIMLLFSCKKNEDAAPAPPATISTVTGPTGLTSGPKNTVITITGTNFITDLSQIQVKVNGKACTVLTATATTITAQIPPACGTGIVELFLNGIRYAGPVFNFVYTYTLSSLTNGQVGYADGPVATAKFEEIIGITIDGQDNIYTAQYNNPRVRKISASNVVSTLAGSGVTGDLDGQGVNAKFSGLDFCAADQAGNVYLADQGNFKIRKIDLSGNVTTIANTPVDYQSVKVGKSGNLYLSSNNSIAKYSATGTLIWRLVTHGSGNVDGDTSIVQWKGLYGGIEVDETETNIYVTVTDFGAGYASTVKKLNLANKTVTTIAGDGTAGNTSGPALSCKFKLITCTQLDKAGGLYIADGFNARLCYLKDGTVTTVIGLPGQGDVDGDASVAKINYPHGLAFDSKNQLFIGNAGTTKIKKLVID